MKPYLEHLLKAASDSTEAQGLVREYLHARNPGILQQAGAFLCLSFHGGTALRFLYDIPRYSEDLDFSLDRAPGNVTSPHICGPSKTSSPQRTTR